MTKDDLGKYDFVLLIDKSGSMSQPAKAGGSMSRWKVAEEMSEAVAVEMGKYDDDGITVIPFSGSFKEYKNITGGLDQVKDIFAHNSPNGSTAVHLALQHVVDGYFKDKKSSPSEVKPMLIAIVTDGEPDDKDALERLIIDTSKKLDSEDELQFHFLQVGDDQDAHNYLVHLDTGLKKKVKYDIVGVRTSADMDNISVLDAILANDE